MEYATRETCSSRPGNARVLDGPHRVDRSASGQVAEFRLWTELIQQSCGELHVFLPLLDRGIDGVIHRLTDGDYIPVQVKSRSTSREGMVDIMIPGNRLVEDRALIIAGFLTDEGFGPMLLVVDEGTFKHVAACNVVAGEDIYSAWFSVDNSATSHWRPYLVPREQLAERLMGKPPSGPSVEVPTNFGLRPIDRHNQWLGFLGESEVVRRLAENSRFDLYRPFPDLEIVEVLVRDDVTARFVGLQVKTAVPMAPHDEAHIGIRKATFVPTASTFVVCLAWIPERERFADECLVVPTEELTRIALNDGAHWRLNFHPHSPERTPVDPYRWPLANISERLAQIASGVQ